MHQFLRRKEVDVNPFRSGHRHPRLCLVAAVVVGLFATVQEVQAIPYFARRHNLRCTTCHLLPPKLNASGEAFFARGYRLPPELERPITSTVPFAAWISGRYEKNFSKDFSEGFLNKVELISGGPIGDLPLSYFVEWRLGSQQTRGDGSLRDRSGRFEDIFVNVEIDKRNTFTIGQYRALNQLDVSRRLSLSEPALFSTSLPGRKARNKRIQSLRAFSPSGRSPGFTYQLQSMLGERTSDGLFHFVTVPFAGEISLPLTPEAQDEASFELEGRPKGVFLETFYRQGLNSVGAHAFVDSDRWLLQGAGTLNYKDFYATGGVGVDRRDGSSRVRYSIEGEYIATFWDAFRPALGFRVEQITNSNREPAFIPYVALSGPNTTYTFLLNIQYRAQKDNSAIVIEVGTVF